MLKRVIVYNNIANLRNNDEQQYLDYFNFIEPNFVKTFYTMFNTADVPSPLVTIQERLSYFQNEAPKIFSALVEAGIHDDLTISTYDEVADTERNEMVQNFVITLISLYLTNYEKDGRFESEEFQEEFFGYIKNLFVNKEIAEIIPDEYKYIFQFLVRKLLWYYTTIDTKRDEEYLSGAVDELLTYVLENSDWYNEYEANATAIRNNAGEDIQLETYQTETETETQEV